MIARMFGLVALVGSLAVIYLFESAGAMTGAFRVLHWPAIFLTAVGPFGLVFLAGDWQVIRQTMTYLLSHSPSTWQARSEHDGVVLQSLSQEYYTRGSSAFDQIDMNQISLPLKRTVDRLSIKVPVADTRALLEKELERSEGRLTRSINLVGVGVRMAPSIGMLGTILGMVQLLSSLSDPTHIGSHMSLALLTTFYGLFFSLVVWTPVQLRLEALLDSHIHGHEQILHWLELLEKRKPAQYFMEMVEERAPAASGKRAVPERAEA